MAVLSPQRQVVFIAAAVLCVTGASYEQSESDPIPSAGPALAQASVKHYGAALLSEATQSGTMDKFASLDDIYDEKNTMASFEESVDQSEQSVEPRTSAGPSLAQASVKHTGATLLSEATGAMDKFASLDDAFDETKDIQAEPSEFSVKELLASPSLYFTIALVLGAGLLLTAKDEPQPQVNTSEKRKEKEQKIQQDRQVPKIDVSKVDAAKAAPAPQAAPAVANPPAEGGLNIEAVEAPAPKAAADPQALMAAVEACRGSQAGSYENFCKLLAANNNVQ